MTLRADRSKRCDRAAAEALSSDRSPGADADTAQALTVTAILRDLANSHDGNTNRPKS
jgi:hypothetical protein